MLPALAATAGGAALKAGVGGFQDLLSQREEQERARRNALRQLSGKFQANTGGDYTFDAPPELPQTQGVGEAVIAPMLQAGANSATQSTLNPAKPGEDEEEWYKSAARGFFGAK